MDAVVLSLGALAVAASGLTAVELHDRRRWQRTVQTVELRFGRDVTPEAVVAVIDLLGAQRRARPLLLDLVADHKGLRYYATADRSGLDQLRIAFRAQVPSVRVLPSKSLKRRWRLGRTVTLRGRLRTLRETRASDLDSQAILAALQPLQAGERLLLRWIVRPGRAAQLPSVELGVAVEPEDRRRLRVKNAGGIVEVSGLVAVQAASDGRARQLLNRVEAALQTRASAYGRFSFVRGAVRHGRLATLLPGLVHDRYASAELAPLLGWPIGAPSLPGLTLGTSPLLMPSDRLPKHGRHFGTATWPDNQRPIAQPLLGALSHGLVVGPTGVGKSTLLLNLMLEDVRAGRGLVLIDGKGDTAHGLLARIPKARRQDVIVLDCASDGPLPGLRLLGGAQSDLAADVVLGVLADLFKDNWGPLSERYLRAGLQAVATDPQGTLADVPFVFSDAAYRRRLAGQLRDPLMRSVFAGFEAMSAGERQQQLAAPLGKLGQLLGRPVVRTVLGQAQPQLDMETVLGRQQIVVISLAPARVGAGAARLIGAVCVHLLFQAVLARSGLSPGARQPFLVYLDEPKALGDLPMPVDSLLEQARGLEVGITLAPQSLSQLPKTIREAALTNAATRVIFRQAAADARLLAQDLPGVTPEALGDLAAFEAVARINLGPGDVAPPVTLRTSPAPRALGDWRVLRNEAERRYGLSTEEVDRQLAERHRAAAIDAPVGRKRRAS